MAVRTDPGSLAEVESLEREAQEKEEQLRSRSGDPAAAIQSLHKARTALSTVVGDLRLSGLQPPVGAEALLKEDPLTPMPEVLEAVDHALTLRREAASARIRAARLSIQDLARQAGATSSLVQKLADAERAARGAVQTHRDQQGQAARALEEARKATVQLAPMKKSPSFPGGSEPQIRALDHGRRATIQAAPQELPDAPREPSPFSPFDARAEAGSPHAPSPFEPAAPLPSPFARDPGAIPLGNPGFAPVPLVAQKLTPKSKGNVNPTQPGVQVIRPSSPSAPSIAPLGIAKTAPSAQPLRPAASPTSVPKVVLSPSMVMPPEPRQPEAPRRAFPRAKLDVKVDMESDHNFFTGFSSDISEGGIFIATVNILALGSEVEVSLQLPKGNKIAAKGKVRWIREPEADHRSVPGMGVQFTDLEPEFRAAIETFIGKRDPIFFED